jgi:hypothetical protein
MSRFIDVNDEVIEVFLRVLEERFPSLINLKIKIVFDTKRRIKQGDICLASVELTSDKLKYFSKDEVATEGYDIVVILDMKAWELSDDADRIRIMSHELRHILIDEEKLKLLPHDISDFRVEQQLNKDNPDWRFRLATLTNDIYEQEKEEAKQKKKGNKEAPYG